MRRAAKIDANQPAIVQELRDCHVEVAITSAVGQGFPDLVVSASGVNLLVELKDPAKPPSKRKLTEDQVKFHGRWRGPIIKAETTKEILTALHELSK